jgi:uncharacterized protein (DUF2252 family)
MPSTQAWARKTVEESIADGREARRVVPRSAHVGWRPAADRPDPVALLRAQDAARQQDLVPIRWGRMSASPFAFYRGAAALMAADLAPLPRTDLTVQLCGDAHLSNFGVYASPERTMLFDVNDFDETLPGPFEWDIKRLAASFVIAARFVGFTDDVAREAALAAVRSYREHMAAYAEMRGMDVWYSRVDVDELLAESRETKGVRYKAISKGIDKARTRNSLEAAGKLTTVVDGRRQINDQPPLIMHVSWSDEADRVRTLLRKYVSTLEDDRRELMERFVPLDIARKVVGVGSVGTYCLIVLFEGRDGDDPLLLQVKEATESVLEPYLGRSRFQHAGHRVVAGQRLMQAASDIFLGWLTSLDGSRHYYLRQLRDMKWSVPLEGARPAGTRLYAEACGWALARGHARSGRRNAIASYLGISDKFDRAIADFASVYADQTERDFEVIQKAIKDGRIPVESGV